MTIATALTILAALAPYIPEGITGLDAFVTSIKGGESLEALIAEFEAKRNDLENLTFGQ